MASRHGEAVLTSTHNKCFGAKIRKKGMLLQTPVFFFYLKLGFKRVYFSWLRFPDAVERRLPGFSWRRGTVTVTLTRAHTANTLTVPVDLCHR